MTAVPPPKGILKGNDHIHTNNRQHPSPPSPPPPKHVKWDEVKLKATDEEKAEFARGQFANEPKTPFHAPLQPAVEVDEFKLATLTEDEDSLSASSPSVSSASSSASSSSSSFTDSEAESHHSIASSNGSNQDDNDNDNDNDNDRHERFLALRAQHYFMKEAFQRGKHLIDSDDDDDDEEEEEEED